MSGSPERLDEFSTKGRKMIENLAAQNRCTIPSAAD
jgi:hypothetical protein